MSGGLPEQKRALRAELRERRQVMTALERETAGASLTSHLDALVGAREARIVSCYLPALGEPDTRGFLRLAARRGIRVLLPVSRDDGLLDWALAGPSGADGTDDGETVGLHGMPEPSGPRLGPMAADDVDLMLIPARAVDLQGMRLGGGRGYYDRVLGSMAVPPPVFAIVYDHEIVDEVPHETHDQPVDGAVTPSGLRTFGGRVS